jgi:hypothetical protein
MMGKIDIRGIDKAVLLRQLHGHTKAFGNGTQVDVPSVSLQACQLFIDRSTRSGRGDRAIIDIDYLAGRPIKCEIGGDELDPFLFDRDAGEGAAARAVAAARVESLLSSGAGLKG